MLLKVTIWRRTRLISTELIQLEQTSPCCLNPLLNNSRSGEKNELVLSFKMEIWWNMYLEGKLCWSPRHKLNMSISLWILENSVVELRQELCELIVTKSCSCSNLSSSSELCHFSSLQLYPWLPLSVSPFLGRFLFSQGNMKDQLVRCSCWSLSS